MADKENDPTRWSHSSGEMQEIQRRIDEASERDTRYSGVEADGDVVITANPIELRLIMSSGEKARERAGAAEKKYA
jgi:hypothetical protein